MLSTALELAGFSAFTAAAYMVGGIVAALCVFGVACVLTALAVDASARPRPARAARRAAKPKVPAPPTAPLTNAEFDELLAAELQ